MIKACQCLSINSEGAPPLFFFNNSGINGPGPVLLEEFNRGGGLGPSAYNIGCGPATWISPTRPKI